MLILMLKMPKLSIVLLLLFITTFGISQQYYTFPTDNAIWNNYSIHSIGPSTVDMDIDRLCLFGDTIINNNKFSKIYLINNDTTINPNKLTYHAAIRENEIKQILVIYPENEEEILVYDFSLGLGDTVITNATEGNLSIGANIISEIDSVELFNGSIRKRFKINNWDYWIEGIGSTRGLLTPIEFTSNNPNYYYGLTCLKEQDNVVYLNSIYCELCFCWKTTSIDEYKNSKDLLTVHPNPFNNSIVIEGKLNGERVNYKIYSSNGYLIREGVFTSFPHIIQTGQLQKGIYVIKLLVGDYVLSRKIIKK